MKYLLTASKRSIAQILVVVGNNLFKNEIRSKNNLISRYS